MRPANWLALDGCADRGLSAHAAETVTLHNALKLLPFDIPVTSTQSFPRRVYCMRFTSGIPLNSAILRLGTVPAFLKCPNKLLLVCFSLFLVIGNLYRFVGVLLHGLDHDL